MELDPYESPAVIGVEWRNQTKGSQASGYTCKLFLCCRRLSWFDIHWGAKAELGKNLIPSKRFEIRKYAD